MLTVFSLSFSTEVSPMLFTDSRTPDGYEIPAFPAYSKRIEKLLANRNDWEDWQEVPRRTAVYRQVFSECPNDPACLRFARGFERFLQEKRILVQDCDVFAGHAFRYTYETTLPVALRECTEYFRLAGKMSIPEEIRTYESLPGTDHSPETLARMRAFETAEKNMLFRSYFSGHVIADYPRILKEGLGAVTESVRRDMEAQLDPEKRKCVEGMLLSVKALSAYLRRYAAEYRRLAENATAGSAERDYMEMLADMCGRLSTEAPVHFREAVQLYWIVHEALLAETMPASFSLGRMDLYLDSFYRRDLESGFLTRDEAYEILEALFIKFSATIQGYQNVTIGGSLPDGSIMDSDLTVMFLEIMEKMRFDQPLLSLRVADGLPDRVWDASMRLLSAGTGFPAFFGEKVIIETKQQQGLSREDARDFGIMGCAEIIGVGNEEILPAMLQFNMPKVLELMLNHGKNMLTGDSCPLKNDRDLASFTNFEDFYEWYKEEMIAYLDQGLFYTDRIEAILGTAWPAPLLSSLMQGCSKKGLDVNAGGTVYNNSSVNILGPATAVDSLLAIRYAVFEKRLVRLEELSEALQSDFAGNDILRRILSEKPLTYGNDNDEADLMMRDLTNLLFAHLDSCPNVRGGKRVLSLVAAEVHSYMGSCTAATPDGRRARTALSNSQSPSQGKDHTGPTAVMNSHLKTDNHVFGCGMVLDLKFTPSFMASEARRRMVRQLIESYVRRGGMEVQFNVVDRETLLDAQAHPENHRDLLVRVSGFSAYFVLLPKTTQDEIIARTQYGNF